jgi:hypothetical protein
MKKILQILFALILILILTYITFINTSATIQNDLISKAKTLLKDNNITDIGVDIEGEGLNIKRVLILTGSVSTYKEKVKVEILTQNIEGVTTIKNKITISPRVERVQNSLESVIVVPNKVKLKPSSSNKPTLTPALKPTVQPTTIQPISKLTAKPVSTPTLVVEKVQKVSVENQTPKDIKKVEVSTPIPMATPMPIPTESIADTNETKISIPTVVSVPKVIQNNISVPVAIKAVIAPLAIEAVEAVELKTKGVE